MRIVGDRVLGHMGDVLAEKIYGQWESKDPAVLEFIQASSKPVPVKTKEKEEEELVRSRDDEGKFIPDDPSTPDVNEAWTTKIKKKVRRK